MLGGTNLPNVQAAPSPGRGRVGAWRGQSLCRSLQLPGSIPGQPWPAGASGKPLPVVRAVSGRGRGPEPSEARGMGCRACGHWDLRPSDSTASAFTVRPAEAECGLAQRGLARCPFPPTCLSETPSTVRVQEHRTPLTNKSTKNGLWPRNFLSWLEAEEARAQGRPAPDSCGFGAGPPGTRQASAPQGARAAAGACPSAGVGAERHPQGQSTICRVTRSY